MGTIEANGADSRNPASSGHFLYEASRWLATQLRTEPVEMPDGHAPYLRRPEEFVDTLRPLLHALAVTTG